MNSFTIEYNLLVKYSAVIYASSIANPFDYLDKIEVELGTHILKGTYVLFDLLLSNGENYNRFVEAYFDGNKIIQESIKIISITGKELEVINNHYKGRARELNNSILTPSKKFRYMQSK